VHLLVARHGWSCSDIVNQFIGWSDYGRENIHDPLLSGIGQYGAIAAGREVTQWLVGRNYSLDGVMTSFLSREMETGILLLDQKEKPLYVVPYASVARSGKVNEPRTPRSFQLKKIRGTVPGSHNFSANYKWMLTFAAEEQFWEGRYKGEEFEKFLEQSFLPEFVRSSGKPPGSTIVLALVTHSTFIKEAFGQCSRSWSDKPGFSQVLHLQYGFHSTIPAAGSHDVTVRRKLTKVRQPPCEAVTSGLPLTGNERICLSDIGAECNDPIKKEAVWPTTLWEKTAEDEVVDVAKEIHSTETQLKQARQKLNLEMDQYDKASRMSKPDCRNSWSGCQPSALCERKSGIYCVVRHDVDAEGLKKSIAETSKSIAGLGNSLFDLKEKIDTLKSKRCRSGGLPDPAHYVDFVGLDLENRVLELVRAQ